MQIRNVARKLTSGIWVTRGCISISSTISISITGEGGGGVKNKRNLEWLNLQNKSVAKFLPWN